ncbi:MAG: glycosyltransferase family 2 protein [Chloroflexota bacterium]
MEIDPRQPRVAAIVVNWNGGDDTVDCLASLAVSRPGLWRVYVVDNASTDDSVDRIRAVPGGASLIRSDRNRGYAGGFNLGRARALADGAEYLWLLNNDVVVASDALTRLLGADRLERPAILAPLIIRRGTSPPALPDVGRGPESNLDASGGTAIWSGGGYLDWRLKSYHLASEAIGPEVFDVTWASGCSLFCSAQTARLVGPMGERYFLYLEDVDWCLRARARGVPTRVVPGARVYHGVSRSAERLGSPLVWYYSWRNYYLLAREHGTWWQHAYAAGDLGSRFLKICARRLFFPTYRRDPLYRARTHGLLDVVRGRFGEGRLVDPPGDDLARLSAGAP